MWRRTVNKIKKKNTLSEKNVAFFNINIRINVYNCPVTVPVRYRRTFKIFMVPAGGPNTFFIETPFISLPTTRFYFPANTPTISHCFLLYLPLQQTYLERSTRIKNINGLTKNKIVICRARLFLYVLFMRLLTGMWLRG